MKKQVGWLLVAVFIFPVNPHNFKWHCSVLSVSISIQKTCTNMDTGNAE